LRAREGRVARDVPREAFAVVVLLPRELRQTDPPLVVDDRGRGARGALAPAHPRWEVPVLRAGELRVVAAVGEERVAQEEAGGLDRVVADVTPALERAGA